MVVVVYSSLPSLMKMVVGRSLEQSAFQRFNRGYTLHLPFLTWTPFSLQDLLAYSWR